MLYTIAINIGQDHFPPVDADLVTFYTDDPMASIAQEGDRVVYTTLDGGRDVDGVVSSVIHVNHPLSRTIAPACAQRHPDNTGYLGVYNNIYYTTPGFRGFCDLHK